MSERPIEARRRAGRGMGSAPAAGDGGTSRRPAASPGLADLKRLERLLASPLPPRSWSDAELARLPRLYRSACGVLARLEAADEAPETVLRARRAVARAHALLHAPRVARGSPLAVLGRLLLVSAPRAVRAEWRLLVLTAALVYGLAALAWVAVARDLDLAPSLMAPALVENEVEQLSAVAEGERFRGNFTFGLGESPGTAGRIMVNNMGVGILFFASALVPPVYAWLLSTNALMLGTYTAVAGHWGQAGSISSILWCHGVLEIQAILLAGTAGLCLLRAAVRPGARTRRRALAVESRRALLLFLPSFPMLFVAGLIEGYVSPHAPLVTRLVVAAGSALLLALWVASGRERAEPARPAGARPATR